MIDHLIHFYKRGGEPFQSLSALSDTDATMMMEALYLEGSVFWERFEDPKQYLQARRQIEVWLHNAFIAKGGEPAEPYPIYMILGRSKWLEAAGDPITLATTTEILVPLSIFRECDISFTYPDSMVSWLMDQQRNPAYYLPEFHGKDFTLPEIRQVVETMGLPGERWGTNLPSHLANYIEAQVWNREALFEYKRQLSRVD
jgi:hypothetical protein